MRCLLLLVPFVAPCLVLGRILEVDEYGNSKVVNYYNLGNANAGGRNSSSSTPRNQMFESPFLTPVQSSLPEGDAAPVTGGGDLEDLDGLDMVDEAGTKIDEGNSLAVDAEGPVGGVEHAPGVAAGGEPIVGSFVQTSKTTESKMQAAVLDDAEVVALREFVKLIGVNSQTMRSLGSGLIALANFVEKEGYEQKVTGTASEDGGPAPGKVLKGGDSEEEIKQTPRQRLIENELKGRVEEVIGRDADEAQRSDTAAMTSSESDDGEQRGTDQLGAKSGTPPPVAFRREETQATATAPARSGDLVSATPRMKYTRLLQPGVYASMKNFYEQGMYIRYGDTILKDQVKKGLMSGLSAYELFLQHRSRTRSPQEQEDRPKPKITSDEKVHLLSIIDVLYSAEFREGLCKAHLFEGPINEPGVIKLGRITMSTCEWVGQSVFSQPGDGIKIHDGCHAQKTRFDAVITAIDGNTIGKSDDKFNPRSGESSFSPGASQFERWLRLPHQQDESYQDTANDVRELIRIEGKLLELKEDQNNLPSGREEDKKENKKFIKSYFIRFYDSTTDTTSTSLESKVLALMLVRFVNINRLWGWNNDPKSWVLQVRALWHLDEEYPELE
ncbi:unnamed protein product [Amoebophrya sp. A25]|nr:unnamed protein product [Amoebophrya sp. A25]|eukprot:GSA25T00001612001.1